MVYNERKRQSFEFFATRQWVEVPVYAAAVGMYPIRSSYRYLKKLHKYNYLWRGHDFRGVSSTGFRRGVQGGFFGANRLGLLSHGQTEAETLDNTLYLFRGPRKSVGWISRKSLFRRGGAFFLTSLSIELIDEFRDDS